VVEVRGIADLDLPAPLPVCHVLACQALDEDSLSNPSYLLSSYDVFRSKSLLASSAARCVA